jgi:hypothetical protein
LRTTGRIRKVPCICGRNACDQLSQRAANSVQALTLRQSLRVSTGHHDRIGPRWQPVGLQRERLAEQPLHAVAFDGTADLPRHGQAKAPLGRLAAWKRVQHELASGVRPAAPEDPVEVGAARQPRARRGPLRSGEPRD